MKNKKKKLAKFWEQYKGTIIDKGAKEELKRLEQNYKRKRRRHEKN